MTLRLRTVLTHPNTKRVGAAVASGAIGLALNSVPHEAVAHLALGRAVTLANAIVCGPWYGFQCLLQFVWQFA